MLQQKPFEIEVDLWYSIFDVSPYFHSPRPPDNHDRDNTECIAGWKGRQQI